MKRLLYIITIVAVVLLTGCKAKTMYNDGEDVFVSDNNVYVVGSTCEGTSLTDVPTLWINDEPQSIGRMGNFNKATSVFVDGSDVYVTVNEREQGRSFLWKNGTVQELGTKDANSVFVANGNVYVAGKEHDCPVLWINGELTYLSTQGGAANSVYVSGNDVYVAGYMGDYFSGTVVVWINGVENQLGSRGSANCVVVDNEHIYVAGEEHGNAALWVDGECQILSNEKSTAYSVAVSDGDVYVTGIGGFPDGSPKYGVWKNGIRQYVSDDMRDQILSVKINNGNVYLSGSRVAEIPLWVVEETSLN